MRHLGLVLLVPVFLLSAACSQQTPPDNQGTTAVLSLSVEGSGGGTVVSSPSKLVCNADCQGTFDVGTVVTLTATPRFDSRFTGYSGACSGKTCTLTMTEDKAVTATFTLEPQDAFDPVGYYQGYTTKEGSAQQDPATLTITESGSEPGWEGVFDLGGTTLATACLYDDEESRFICGVVQGTDTLVYRGPWTGGMWSGTWEVMDDKGTVTTSGEFHFERQV